MEFWIATTNRGKLGEMKVLLQSSFPQVEVKSLADLPNYNQPPENGNSFLENARIKAKSLKAMKPGVWVIAEDSGIEVEALNNLPGIHSARYAGPKASDSENVAKLLKMLKIRSTGNRKAKFVCQMVAFAPSGEEILTDGILTGNIAPAPKGQAGFGYDPIFVPDNETQTTAELGLPYKNKNSHRAKALKQFIEIAKSKGLG